MPSSVLLLLVAMVAWHVHSYPHWYIVLTCLLGYKADPCKWCLAAVGTLWTTLSEQFKGGTQDLGMIERG